MGARRGSQDPPVSQAHAEFGEYLREMRKRAGLTLQQLSERGSRSVTSYSRLENGLRESFDDDLELYALACDSTFSAISLRRGLLGGEVPRAGLQSPFAGPYVYDSLELTHLVSERGAHLRCDQVRVVKALNPDLWHVGLSATRTGAQGDVGIKYDNGIGARIRIERSVGGFDLLRAEFPRPLNPGEPYRFAFSYSVTDPTLRLPAMFTIAPPVLTESLVVRIQFMDGLPRRLCYLRGLPGAALGELFDPKGLILAEDLEQVELDDFGYAVRSEAAVQPEVVCGFCWEW